MLRDKIAGFVTKIIHTPADTSQFSIPMQIFLWLMKHLSRIYGIIVQFRLFLYKKRIFRNTTLGCQVISIGNLTVGGTGKTPLVEKFARELTKEGRKVAILSRGYARKKTWLFHGYSQSGDKNKRYPHSPCTVSDGEKILSNSRESGDEPFMLALNLPGVVVIVDKNRIRAGLFAIRNFGCDTLILDDGFQYLELASRVEILLIDKTNPFGNGYLLPRGILREPIKNVQRASFIFITKSDGKNTEKLKEKLRKLNNKAEIIECTHKPVCLKDTLTGETLPFEVLLGKPVVVLSGIASPAGFENQIKKLGADIKKTFRFPDHHYYTRRQLLNIIEEAKKLKAEMIVTTQKDAVRLPQLKKYEIPITFLKIDIEIIEGAQDFHHCIAHIAFKT